MSLSYYWIPPDSDAEYVASLVYSPRMLRIADRLANEDRMHIGKSSQGWTFTFDGVFS